MTRRVGLARWWLQESAPLAPSYMPIYRLRHLGHDASAKASVRFTVDREEAFFGRIEANYISLPREIKDGKSCAIAVVAAVNNKRELESEWRLLNRPIDDTNSTSLPPTTTFALVARGRNESALNAGVLLECDDICCRLVGRVLGIGYFVGGGSARWKLEGRKVWTQEQMG